MHLRVHSTQKVLNLQRGLEDVLCRSSSKFELCWIQQESLKAHFLCLVGNLNECAATIHGKCTVISRKSDVFSVDFDWRFPRRPEDLIPVSVAQHLHNDRSRPACAVGRADAMNSHNLRLHTGNPRCKT